MTATRTETDSIGPIEVPADAYWGAQTERSIENFPFPPEERMPHGIVQALAMVKLAAARVNRTHGLDVKIADAIATAAQEIIDDGLSDQFPLVIWQTGSGTQSNMNVNEVIAGRANELLTGTRGGKSPVHPNDHVNMGQSSNDSFPTALHIAAVIAARRDLLPALERLKNAFLDKAKQWDDIVKIGRTHLQDATPLTLGQEFSGYYAQLELAQVRTEPLIAYALTKLDLAPAEIHDDFRTLVDVTAALVSDPAVAPDTDGDLPPADMARMTEQLAKATEPAQHIATYADRNCGLNLNS